MCFGFRYIICKVLPLVLLCCFVSCSGKQEEATGGNGNTSEEIVKPRIVAVFPHDSEAFTQGLLFKEGKLYESTGLSDKSSIRIVDSVGVIFKSVPVPGVFAEGCTFLNGILYQLTWRDGTCFLYSAELDARGTISYEGEGWGLTSDSVSLIMSNGSDTLYYRDSQMVIEKKVAVSKGGVPLTNINELEFARGNIFANVWYSDFIFEISPHTGNVFRTIDCSELVAIENSDSEQNVLNGIAYVQSSNLFYLTGKNWGRLFLVEIP